MTPPGEPTVISEDITYQKHFSNFVADVDDSECFYELKYPHKKTLVLQSLAVILIRVEII